MKQILRKYQSTIHGNYKKNALLYGFLMAIVLFLVLLTRYLIGKPSNSPLTFADNITMLICMFITTYNYKRHLPDKKITFKEGFLLAFYSGMIASIVYGIFIYIYIYGIDMNMPMRCVENLKSIPEYASYNNEQFAQMTKPTVIVLQSIIYNVIMAILWAFVVALMIKNEKAEIKNK